MSDLPTSYFLPHKMVTFYDMSMPHISYTLPFCFCEIHARVASPIVIDINQSVFLIIIVCDVHQCIVCLPHTLCTF